MISLYFFRGNPRHARRRGSRRRRTMSARLLSLALLSDAVRWSPAMRVLLTLMRSHGMSVPRGFPDSSVKASANAALLYVGVLFRRKGDVLVAHVHTARFNGSGRRLLGARLGAVRADAQAGRAHQGAAARTAARRRTASGRRCSDTMRPRSIVARRSKLAGPVRPIAQRADSHAVAATYSSARNCTPQMRGSLT